MGIAAFNPIRNDIDLRRSCENAEKPGAMRAVGLANGANPIAIVVPCHRVIGASGALTGFGGGLHRKRWLLEHEGVLLRSADHSNELTTRRN